MRPPGRGTTHATLATVDPVSKQDGSTGEIRGIHAERVARFFRDNVPGGDVPLAYELLAGGRSNLT